MIKLFIIAAVGVTMLVTACNNQPEQQQPRFAADSKAVTGSDKGAVIFNEKCAMCHSKTKDIAGPALKGVLERWDNDSARLKSFIQNNTKMIAAGDPAAVRTYEKYKSTMPVFPSLSDEDLNNLVDFLNE